MSRALSKAIEVLSINPDIPTKALGEMLNISERTVYRAKAKYNSMLKDDSSFPHGYNDPCTALVIGDTHFPAINKKAVDVALCYAKEKQIDTIIFNGDILDANSISVHPKAPNETTLAQDIEMAKVFIKEVRELFPDAKIFYNNSNHEEFRLLNYLKKKAPELFDLEILSLPNLLGLKDLNIHFIDNKERLIHGIKPFSLSKLVVDHGDSIGVKTAVNTSRALYLKAGCNLLVHHFHRTQSQIFRRFDGSLVTVVCVGCLTNLNPQYLPFSAHNLGFGIVKTYPNGYFEIDNKIILDVYGEYKILNA